MQLDSYIEEIEQKHDVKVIYLTLSGSKLYGTNTPDSNTDISGIFVPSEESVLLKKDPETISFTTGNDKQKNSKDDVDFTLHSIYKWFRLLSKGETGALDLLFSMFSPSVVLFNIEVDEFRQNYLKLINKNTKAFTGYAVGQSKKYGIKGSRYKEFLRFKEQVQEMGIDHEAKLGEYFDKFELDGFKYIEMKLADGPKTGKSDNKILYISILGKMFSGDVRGAYFLEKLEKMDFGYGNRTKASLEGTDWKALSHAVRVILEVEELLKDKFITFPLKEKEFIKDIKQGKIPLEEVMNFIDFKLDEVNGLIETSDLPAESDKKYMDEQILKFVRNMK